MILARHVRVVAAVALLAAAGAIVSPGGGKVVALPNRETVALDADDVVRIMRMAGFSDSQILNMGTDLRNQLARAGAAQVQLGDKVEASFAVNGRYVYVATSMHGSFIYDTAAGAAPSSGSPAAPTGAAREVR